VVTADILTSKQFPWRRNLRATRLPKANVREPVTRQVEGTAVAATATPSNNNQFGSAQQPNYLDWTGLSGLPTEPKGFPRSLEYQFHAPKSPATRQWTGSRRPLDRN